MNNTIDMQLMRYINLFEKISRISTNKCFVYNNTLFFVVPAGLVSRAIGKNAENVRRLSDILRKKIKVISLNENIGDFIKNVIEPYGFVKCEINNQCVHLTANKQNKAGIIGRNRQRERELEDVLKKFFGMHELKIL